MYTFTWNSNAFKMCLHILSFRVLEESGHSSVVTSKNPSCQVAPFALCMRKQNIKTQKNAMGLGLFNNNLLRFKSI